MADSLLNNSEPQTEVEFDPSKDYFAELVGDGKKFKTSADVAKKIYHADTTIELMKKRLDEDHAEILRLRQETETKARLEDLVNQLPNQKDKLTSSKPPIANEVIEQPQYDLKDIESLVSKKIQEIDLSKRQQENFNIVRDKLIERFGRDYPSAVKEQIDTLGISAEDFDAMARKSPKAVFATLGFDQQRQDTFNAPPRGSNMTTAFKPTVQKRTWSYYQDMKAKNPKQWNDRSTMIQMQKDAIELGDAFRDGDYNA